MSQKLQPLSVLRVAYRRVYNGLGRLFLFSIGYNLMISLAVKPLMRLILSLTMRVKGYPVLLNKDITRYFRSMTGLIVGVLLMVFASVVVYYEFSVLLFEVKTAPARQRMAAKDRRQRSVIGLLYSSERALLSLKNLANKDLAGFVLYSLLLLPLLNMGLHSTLLPAINIPNFILGEVRKHTGGEVVLAAVVIAAIYLYARLFYVLPIMVFEETPFFKACKKSFAITRGNQLRTLLVAFLALFSSILVLLLPVIVFFALRSAVFLPFRLISFLVLTVGMELLPATLLATSLSAYEDLTGSVQVVERDHQMKELDSRLRKLVKSATDGITRLWNKGKQWFERHAPSWLVQRPYILLIVLLVPLVFFSDILFPLAFEQQGTMVIGHRGSLDGVENTIEALQGAVDQQADYAEIDVLLSADGVPMVIHDNNLKRLSGESGKVSQLTAKELEKYTLRDRGYTGKISTLEEICTFADGKIQLLVEFKSHGEETDSLIEETVEVIRRLGMEQQVIYQTMEPALFQEMRIKYPDYSLGFIIAGHLGRLSTRKIHNLGADFLVFEEWQITNTLVRAVHRAGIPLYVWTVNDTADAQEYAGLLVDGVITDYPGEVREALREVDALPRTLLGPKEDEPTGQSTQRKYLPNMEEYFIDNLQ